MIVENEMDSDSDSDSEARFLVRYRDYILWPWISTSSTTNLSIWLILFNVLYIWFQSAVTSQTWSYSIAWCQNMASLKNQLRIDWLIWRHKLASFRARRFVRAQCWVPHRMGAPFQTLRLLSWHCWWDRTQSEGEFQWFVDWLRRSSVVASACH